MNKIVKCIIVNESNRFYFIFLNEDNIIQLKSIPYKLENDCLKSLLLVKRYGGSEDNYLRMLSPDEKFYFILRDEALKELASGRYVDSMNERNQLIFECIRFINSTAFSPKDIG